ncbi:pyridoxal phosphate-dependent aminotransferase [Arthrobacter celericrescens]|uniref:pyridoxal phosphate-dependent aminotransferase n=1 Tax=Arthrobacter celericrescens TaxID=2320851 RepID=UPI000EA11768|nr:pyridoxal phosphate-dependent aminotransferase [Arthrobacter celericrescens]
MSAGVRAAVAVERITRASRRSATLGAAVEGAVSLAMGEPDGGTPPAVVDAAIAALKDGRTRYAPMTGAPALRGAIAADVTGRTGRQTTPDEVVLTHGGSAALGAAFLALLNPGDKVLIPEPTYSLYADQAALAGAEVVWVPPRRDGSLDLEALRREAADARLLVLCNPGNPTGAVYGPAELLGVAELLLENPNLVLLSDEAYGTIVFDGVPFVSALSLERVPGQVLVCGTFSKSYAMTGWRLGYVIAPTALADPVSLIHRTLNGPLNTFVQDAALTALETSEEDLEQLRESYQARRDLVLAKLGTEPRVSLRRPQGAFYAFPRIDTTLGSDAMAARFAEAGVLVRPGSEFGASGEGHVRLSFATDTESLEAALERLLAAVRDMP